MQAISCRILPGAHWALLYVIAFTFVLTFIMFETGGSFSSEGRHTLWTLLCSLMVFVLTVRGHLCTPWLPPSGGCAVRGFAHDLLPCSLMSCQMASNICGQTTASRHLVEPSYVQSQVEYMSSIASRQWFRLGAGSPRD